MTAQVGAPAHRADRVVHVLILRRATLSDQWRRPVRDYASGQPVGDPLVDLLGPLHQHEVPDALDQLGVGARTGVALDPLDLLLGHAVAAVGGAVQVEHRLRGAAAPGGLLLGGPLGRAEARRVELAPVVAQGGAQVVRVAQRLADVDHVVVGP